MFGIYGILTLFFLVYIPIVEGARPYSIELLNITCWFNKNVFSEMTLKLIKSNQRNVVNGSIVTAIPLENFQLGVTVQSLKHNGRFWTLVNGTIDGCDFVEQRFRVTLNLHMQVLMEFRRFLPNIQKCPLKKNFEIIVQNLFVNEENLPGYLPEAEFNATLSMMFQKTKGFAVTSLGRIVSKEKLKLKKN